MKLTEEEKNLVLAAKAGGIEISSELSEKIDAIANESDGRTEAGRVCCEYYSMGRVRYKKIPAVDCSAIAGTVVDDGNC